MTDEDEPRGFGLIPLHKEQPYPRNQPAQPLTLEELIDAIQAAIGHGYGFDLDHEDLPTVLKALEALHAKQTP
jgi:hypothetical protein